MFKITYCWYLSVFNFKKLQRSLQMKDRALVRQESNAVQKGTNILTKQKKRSSESSDKSTVLMDNEFAVQLELNGPILPFLTVKEKWR